MACNSLSALARAVALCRVSERGSFKQTVTIPQQRRSGQYLLVGLWISMPQLHIKLNAEPQAIMRYHEDLIASGHDVGPYRPEFRKGWVSKINYSDNNIDSGMDHNHAGVKQAEEVDGTRCKYTWPELRWIWGGLLGQSIVMYTVCARREVFEHTGIIDNLSAQQKRKSAASLWFAHYCPLRLSSQRCEILEIAVTYTDFHVELSCEPALRERWLYKWLR